MQARFFIERAFPLGHGDGCDRIAEEIGWREPLGHQPVDAKHQCDPGDRYAAFRTKRRRENNEGCARYAGCAFRRYQQDEKQSDLMPDIKRRVRGLSKKQGGCRKVKAGLRGLP
jgi:hypothetical protein